VSVGECCGLTKKPTSGPEWLLLNTTALIGFKMWVMYYIAWLVGMLVFLVFGMKARHD
jgi:hypothetical protein